MSIPEKLPVPDVGMDNYIVREGKNSKVETSGIGPCFGIAFKNGDKIALTHTSHLAPVEQVIEGVLGEMHPTPGQPTTIEVAGGMARFGKDYPGTKEEEKEIMSIAKSYGIVKTSFNHTTPDGPPLTMTVTPTRTTLQLKPPGNTEDGKPLSDILSLKDESMQKKLDDAMDETEADLVDKIEDGIGDGRSAQDIIREQQDFYSQLTDAERRDLDASIDQIKQEIDDQMIKK